jgi:hypothetical protein
MANQIPKAPNAIGRRLATKRKNETIHMNDANNKQNVELCSLQADHSILTGFLKRDLPRTPAEREEYNML